MSGARPHDGTDAASAMTAAQQKGLVVLLVLFAAYVLARLW